MKSIKKTGAYIIAIFTFLMCTLLAACGNKNAEVYSRYEIYSPASFHLYPYGVPFSYGIENATIEMSNRSDMGMVVFDDYNAVRDYESYPYYSEPDASYGGIKKSAFENRPLYYEGKPVFQWRPVDGFAQENTVNIEDYITFIARKDNKIVGYAVIKVWTESEYAYGKVIADKEVSDMNEEAVKEKISKITDGNKK